MRNRIINGAMVISQRNGTSSVTPSTDSYVIDRWKVWMTQASKYSVQQNAGSVTTPVGFANYLGVTSLAATTVGASDYFMLSQAIEGFNTSDLAWGTASAKTVTLSFQVYSSLTGTFGGALQNSANNRSYPFSYSIPVANTWTTISITVAGDTTGTWIGATNGIGIMLRLGLGVGSTLSGTAGSWAGASYFSATGATSVVGTNGATFYITGVQLEVGTQATSFEYRQYQQELALCQRYYERTANADNVITVMTRIDTNTSTCGNINFAVEKRASPTIQVTRDSFSSPTGTLVSLQGGYPSVTPSLITASTSSITEIRFSSIQATPLGGGYIASIEL
jgi:hypothetical protein